MPAPAVARRRRFIRPLAVLLTSTVVVLVAAEVFVRVYLEGKFDRRPPFYVPHEPSVFANTPILDHNFHGSDYSTHIRTNDLGCRLGKLGEVPDDAQLILLSGDSHTFGWGVNTDETWASMLDEMVSEASAGRARIVNLGVAGYGSLQSAVRLREYVAARPSARVRCVIFTHCQNDVTDNAILNRLAVMIGVKRCVTNQWLVLRNGSPSSFWNLLSRTKTILQTSSDRRPDIVP